MRRVPIFAALAALLSIAAAQAAELPEQIKQAGSFRLMVSSTYAPMEYRDPATNELTGLDIDLATEIAKRLSLKIVWSETAFAAIIPALQTKRADFVISGITDRPSRRETADFIDYLKTGPQFFVLAPSSAQAAIDLCGQKVGTTRSTIFPLGDREVEQGQLRGGRKALRAVCSRRERHRCSQPAKAGPDRRSGPGQ